ncbi:hypothetical protein [Maricaulis sp.]|uniref:hypothetical protein n=1 Tax=Maricaulis sp. TaxID=1486257 RepID=UPI003A9203DF
MSQRQFLMRAALTCELVAGNKMAYRLNGPVFQGCVLDAVPNQKGQFFCCLVVCNLASCFPGIPLDISKRLRRSNRPRGEEEIWHATAEEFELEEFAAVLKTQAPSFWARTGSLEGIIQHVLAEAHPQYGALNEAMLSAILLRNANLAVKFGQEMRVILEGSIQRAPCRLEGTEKRLAMISDMLQKLETGDLELLATGLMEQVERKKAALFRK